MSLKPETLPQTPPVRPVFVYGTLRRGEVRDINRLQPAPRWVGPASVAGVLYDLGAYPGLRLGGPERVLGEVYEISAELEQQLDEIEDVWPQPSGEYARREVAVRLDRAASLHRAESGDSPGERPEVMVCLLYEVAPARTLGKPIIASGDWVQYRADGAR